MSRSRRGHSVAVLVVVVVRGHVLLFFDVDLVDFLLVFVAVIAGLLLLVLLLTLARREKKGLGLFGGGVVFGEGFILFIALVVGRGVHVLLRRGWTALSYS